jgi:transposase, IS5 family
MKQVTLDLNLDIKKTRKREFLVQMDKVVPWNERVALIAPITLMATQVRHSLNVSH